MGTVERTILAELSRLREAEAALEVMFESLRGGGATSGKSFMNSLRALDATVTRLETFLERGA